MSDSVYAILLILFGLGILVLSERSRMISIEAKVVAQQVIIDKFMRREWAKQKVEECERGIGLGTNEYMYPKWKNEANGVIK